MILLTFGERNHVPKAVKVAFRAGKGRPGSRSYGTPAELEPKLSVEDLDRYHVVGKIDVDEVEESSP